MKDKNGLNKRQLLFIREYLTDLNATQAAIRAGYSIKTAGQMGDENLKKPKIAAAVKKAMDERSERVLVTADDVLQSILTLRKMAIDSDRISDGLKANELLGKHLKLFTDKIEASVQTTQLPANVDDFI